MSAHVYFQPVVNSKAFPTQVTFEGPLPGMDMHFQLPISGKACNAHVTFEGVFILVCLNMRVQTHNLRKA